MKRTLLIIAILLSFVCTNGQSPKKIYEDIKNKKIKAFFHGSGTEPFWDIYILESSAIYADEMAEVYEYWKIETKFDKTKYAQTINFKNANGEKSSVKIIKKPCTDGMSPQKYTYTVIYDNRNGCGNVGN
jgi:uncharacterized membrane protein